MKREMTKRGIIAGLMMAFLIIAMFACTARAAEEPAIEQVVINKPSVIVDYRGDLEQVPTAFLDGEELKQVSPPLKLADSGIGIQYCVLLDVSGSLSPERFENIKASLQQFLTELRENDSLVLYTFGDAVTKLLNGDEDRESAAATIAQIANGDMNTTLFEALNTASSEIENALGDGTHRLIICISDGEDFADNTKDAETVSESIASKGIPVYTIAVEKKSETENEARDNRSRFSSIATETGGVPWTVDQLQEGMSSITENSVMNGLAILRDTVLNTNHLALNASSNIISMKIEDLVLRFPDDKELTRKVLVTRHIADDTAPTVTEVKVVSENEILITYSESLQGAEKSENYKVSQGHTIPVSQVIFDDAMSNSYSLILSEKLTNGEYTLQIQNVTDNTQEKNPLTDYSEPKTCVVDTLEENKDLVKPTVKTITASVPDGFEIVFSEKVSGAENNGNYSVKLDKKDIPVIQAKALGDDGTKYKIVLAEKLTNGKYTIEMNHITDASEEANKLDKASWSSEVKGIEEKVDILALILKWWPIVLTGVVVLLLVIIILYYRRMKKNNVTIIEGVAVEKGHINKKVQVNIGENQEPRDVEIEINNGSDSPRKIPYTIRGGLTVGRSKEDSDIFCNDSIMSRKHFRIISAKDGKLYVEDLGSKNGTHVNGTRISTKTEIHSGDDIRAGKMHFRVFWNM